MEKGTIYIQINRNSCCVFLAMCALSVHKEQCLKDGQRTRVVASGESQEGPGVPCLGEGTPVLSLTTYL